MIDDIGEFGGIARAFGEDRHIFCFSVSVCAERADPQIHCPAVGTRGEALVGRWDNRGAVRCLGADASRALRTILDNRSAVPIASVQPSMPWPTLRKTLSRGWLTIGRELGVMGLS